MRVLVTGGAGFIGWHLFNRLREIDGIEVWSVDRRPMPEAVEHAVTGDLAEIDLAAEIGSVDVVYHVAANSSARLSHEDVDQELRDNVIAPLKVLEYCREVGVSRVVLTSSMAVYGDTGAEPVSESGKLAPTSNYGAHKQLLEAYGGVYRQFGIEPWVFRLFNVYGPGQDMENLKQGMVSIYMRYIRDGVEIPVTGSLDRFRDFVYVDDVVDALEMALVGDGLPPGTYNVASGVRTTVNDLIREIASAWGHPGGAYPVRAVEGHAGDVLGNVADVDRLKAFGWSPRHSLGDGLAKMVGWARQEVGSA